MGRGSEFISYSVCLLLYAEKPGSACPGRWASSRVMGGETWAVPQGLHHLVGSLSEFHAATNWGAKWHLI